MHDPSARTRSDHRYALGIGKLRRNGFVSVGAGETREGMLATQPFMSDGDRLVVNAACGPGGYLKVEVRDARDQVLPGRALGDSDTFAGDSVRHTVAWRGDANLPLPKDADSGTVYTRFIPHRRLRFVMRKRGVVLIHHRAVRQLESQPKPVGPLLRHWPLQEPMNRTISPVMVVAVVTDPRTAITIQRVKLWRSDFHSARAAWISTFTDWMSAFVAKRRESGLERGLNGG